MTNPKQRSSVRANIVQPKKKNCTKPRGTIIIDELMRNRLGSVLRILRIANDLSITQLSDITGICISTLSRIELGYHCPSSQVLEKCAAGLNVSVDTISRFCKEPSKSEFNYKTMLVKITQELLDIEKGKTPSR